MDIPFRMNIEGNINGFHHIFKLLELQVHISCYYNSVKAHETVINVKHASFFAPKSRKRSAGYAFEKLQQIIQEQLFKNI